MLAFIDGKQVFASGPKFSNREVSSFSDAHLGQWLRGKLLPQCTDYSIATRYVTIGGKELQAGVDRIDYQSGYFLIDEYASGFVVVYSEDANVLSEAFIRGAVFMFSSRSAADAVLKAAEEFATK